MNLSALANRLAIFLLPFLPILTAEQKQEAAHSGEPSADAKRVWTLLGPALHADSISQEIVKKAILRPDDPRIVAMFELQIEEILMQDKTLCAEILFLQQTLHSLHGIETQSKNNGIVIGGNMNGGINMIGNGNIIGGSQYNTEIDKAEGTSIGDAARIDLDVRKKNL